MTTENFESNLIQKSQQHVKINGREQIRFYGKYQPSAELVAVNRETSPPKILLLHVLNNALLETQLLLVT
jgi:hypothetical protein